MDIAILSQSFEPVAQAGKFKIFGTAIASNNFQIGWEVTVNYSDNASTINAAITAAAVAEFGRANPPVVVAGGDRKALFGGVV